MSAAGKYGNYNEGQGIAKRITNNLRIIFKDQSIRTISMCLGIRDKMIFDQHNIEEAFMPIINNRNLFALSKININDHHTSREDVSTYMTKEYDDQLYEYIDI